MLDKSHGSNRGKCIKDNYEIWLKYASRHCQYGNKEITLENTCIIFNVNSQNWNAKSAQYKRSE